MTPEMIQYLIYGGLMIAGYFMRHFHINVPLLPQSPNQGTNTPSPLPTPPANDQGPILAILSQLQQQLASHGGLIAELRARSAAANPSTPLVPPAQQ